MSKMLAIATVLSLCLLSGCTVVVHRCTHRVETYRGMPKQEVPKEKPPVGPDTDAGVQFFRAEW